VLNALAVLFVVLLLVALSLLLVVSWLTPFFVQRAALFALASSL